MAVVQALTLPLAILATACLPVAVAAILCADELLDRLVWAVGERLDARRERRTVSQLRRMMEEAGLDQSVDLAEPDPDHPRIEEIAANLRRLGRQRLGIAGRSRVWQDAVNRAYDDQLRLACRCLDVVEHLGELDGVDLEIERVRVEGELEVAGFVLPAVAADQGKSR